MPSTQSKTPEEVEYVRPWMYGKQHDAFFNDSRYSVIEASSKAGKTVGAMAWLFEQALFGADGQNFWWIAPIHAQARIAYRRMKRGLPDELFEANESELTITLEHGPILWFKSGDNPDSLYGEDVYGAIIDEASRVKEESWYAVRSTLTATRAPVRLIGNVKGRKNFFYKLARRAEARDRGMAYMKITAYDAVAAGVLNAEEIEDARATLPDAVFRELYLAEPSDDEGNPFGIDAIRARIADTFEEPRDAGRYVMGCDLARSTDYTALVVIHVGTSRVVALDRFQLPWQETINRVRALAGRYRRARIIADSTGVGDAVVEQLQRASRSDGLVVEGFKFTSPSKQNLMEGLAVAIQQGRISYPDDAVLINELESFEFSYHRTGVRYSAPPGEHDDMVDSLALAVSGIHAAQSAHISVEQPESKDKVFSGGKVF